MGVDRDVASRGRAHARETERRGSPCETGAGMHAGAWAGIASVSVRTQQFCFLRGCLVSAGAPKIPFTSNVWTHAWSIKYRLITKQIT